MHDLNDPTPRLSLLPACPSWCSWPAGHPYEDQAADGSYVLRYHEVSQDLGCVSPENPPDSTHNRAVVSVGLSCEERAVADAGPSYLAPLVITLWTENPLLTVAEARAVAELLSRAADQAEALA